MSPSKVSTINWTSFNNVVDGQLRSSKTKHQGTDPVTGDLLWEVPIGTQQDVDDAVVSAQKAFESWSLTSLADRKAALQRYRDHYMVHIEEMTVLLCKETGKPVGPCWVCREDPD